MINSDSGRSRVSVQVLVLVLVFCLVLSSSGSGSSFYVIVGYAGPSAQISQTDSGSSWPRIEWSIWPVFILRQAGQDTVEFTMEFTI